MVRDVAARPMHRHQRRRSQDAAARALVAPSCRSLGVLDLDRRSSVATTFLLGAPMKFQRVDDHYRILLVVSALMQASQQKHRNKYKRGHRESGVYSFGQDIREKKVFGHGRLLESCR
jgi:hypothetical protein